MNEWLQMTISILGTFAILGGLTWLLDWTRHRRMTDRDKAIEQLIDMFEEEDRRILARNASDKGEA